MKGISLTVCVVLLGLGCPATSFAQSSDAGDPGFLKSPARRPLFQVEERAGISAGAVGFTADETRSLLTASANAKLRLPSVEAFASTPGETLEFRRVQVISPQARLTVVTNGVARDFTAPERTFFLATNRSTSIGFAVNPGDGEIRGFGVKNGQRVEVSGLADVGIEFSTSDPLPDGSSTCSTEQDDQPADAIAFIQDEAFQSLSEAPAGTTISYQPLVAIDTDTEWMAGKGNNTTTAMTFITDIFLAMNVFYERDIETQLVVGDVTLRVGSDPYTEPSNRSEQLDEFGEYWRVNLGGVNRDFATMFSGRAVTSGQFSGIAWINQYCKKGAIQGSRTIGSYSYNAMGTGRTPANTALFVGHEIAHNLGSPHTHCYSPPVDQCYNESGCYTGPVSCPAGGKGTIMSYCHVSAASGGAGCGSSLLEFHPTVEALLEGRLADNSPSCVAAYEEPSGEVPIFDSSFENL